jgi:hypothetical protein
LYALDPVSVMTSGRYNKHHLQRSRGHIVVRVDAKLGKKKIKHWREIQEQWQSRVAGLVFHPNLSFGEWQVYLPAGCICLFPFREGEAAPRRFPQGWYFASTRSS